MPRMTVHFPNASSTSDIRPTDEQAAIIQAARTGENLVVIAGAGSGKTSTQRLVSKAMPSRRGFYIAYNKAIANDAQGTFPPNVRCSTAHSLAFRAVGVAYQHRLTGERVPAYRVAEILGIRGFTLEPDEKAPEIPMLPKHLAIIVNDTVQNYCWSADAVITEKHVPWETRLSKKQHNQVARAVVPYAKAAWDDYCKREGGRLRFQHDHYLKMWQLSGVQLPIDFLLLDEAQDANPVIAAIVNQQRNVQKILVGDPAQQIYAWRGAIDAMKDFPGQRLPLSKSFRFGPAIAEQANAFLELLGDFRITGNENIESTVGDIEVGHERAILCRTNAEALSQVILAQDLEEVAPEHSRKAALVGGGRELVALARAAMDLKHGLPTDHRELMLFKSWGEVQEFVHSESAGRDLKVFVQLIDAHGPEKILRIVDSLYEEQDADVIISTAHKAKGREWESVRVAPDFDMDPNGMQDAEIRLDYVTVTRAKLRLDPGGLDWINR
jgi:superfamily I DNA/RNA helicase